MTVAIQTVKATMLPFTNRSGKMISREEAYDLICDLNEEAHAATYEDWVAADEAEDEGEDMDVVEEMREDASYQQAIEFREAFQALMPEDQEAILHYTKTDEDFAMEFNGWWGEE
jgi:hypothetical protein